MRANGFAIPCTVSRLHYSIHFGGRSAERSQFESRRVVSSLVTVRAQHVHRSREWVGLQARKAVEGGASKREWR